MPLNWKPQEFKKQLISDLVANGELVGQFVEQDARQRVLKIPDPEWGAGHRKYVARLITNEVEREKNAVVIRVGLPPGKKTKSGEVTRHLGFYIEMGSARHPAHPYLRPAVFQNGKRIVEILSGK